ncbi:hypothetical protein SOCE26_026820 [Sorangium cellulosum]|uniref:Uncharacterized protein n=1 Tax=Sorangium cellulosum TaxID=56 RepID=A0A2L0EPT3_SORCE|nr:hypothetical protein [Sorangium cellulosum]AUX41272.1 hypothetical protein SOCE26_026820 [Sorangium cellulosum]
MSPRASARQRPATGAPAPLVTPDGRYLVVRGRLWRRADPSLPEDTRRRLVSELMAARREVGRALRAGDEAALRAARRRVNDAKIALGERGPPWWSDGAPDENRRLVASTGYARWYDALCREGACVD